MSTEAHIAIEYLKDAYRNHPALHQNPDAIRLLVDVQNKIEEEIGDREDQLESAESKGYDSGFDDGREQVLDEFSACLDEMEDFIKKMREKIG